MNKQELINWLIENGGPVIRFRTANELCDSTGKDILQLTQYLNESVKVNKLFNELDECLKNSTPWNWHGSKKDCLENVLGRLLELGLNKDINDLDDKIRPLKKWILASDYSDHTPLHSIFFAWCFLRIGYIDNDIVEFIVKRLDRIHASAKEKVYDIYLRGDELKGIPIKFADACIKNEHNPYSGNLPLPLIHDLYALAYFPKNLLNESMISKINDLVDYILDNRFQELPEGYGYLSLKHIGKDYCHSCGWSPNIPGYKNFNFNGIDEDKFFMRFELMSHFKQAHKSKWFHNCLEHVEKYRTTEGTYILPDSYLKEKSSGYYILGAYMGLEEKRTKKAIEIESTFRVLSIKKRVEDSSVDDCII